MKAVSLALSSILTFLLTMMIVHLLAEIIQQGICTAKGLEPHSFWCDRGGDSPLDIALALPMFIVAGISTFFHLRAGRNLAILAHWKRVGIIFAALLLLMFSRTFLR